MNFLYLLFSVQIFNSQSENDCDTIITIAQLDPDEITEWMASVW